MHHGDPAPPASPGHASPAGPAPALSPEHLRQLAEAQQRAKPVRRAIAIAKFDAWTVGIFGALTLLLGVFTIAGWLLGGTLLAVAFIEIRAARDLARMDARAPRRLGLNQIALGAALLTYAMFGLWNVLYGPDPLAETLRQAPEAAEMLAPYSDLIRLTGIAIYAGVACVAIFAQGGMALYYFSRTKHVRAYLAQTPQWLIDFLRASTSN